MPHRLSTLAILLIGAAPLLILAGCLPWISPQDDTSTTTAAKLVPFQSSSELLTYFRDQARARHTWRLGRGFLGSGGFGAAAPDAAEVAAPDASAEPTNGADFSTTNIQEVGVDESDVFKSDGTYFYVARGQTLRIIRATPADEMVEIARLDLGIQADSLYLFESTIIALGTEYGGYGWDGPEIMVWPPYYGRSRSVIQQIDVADPSQPRLIGQLELDGCLVSSRLTNGRLIAVLTIVPNLPDNPTPLTIGQMTLDEVLPKLRRSDGSEEDAVPWSQWLRPASPDGYFMTAVVTLDASAIETVLGSVAVLANAGTIYASTDALYITDTTYDPNRNHRQTTSIHKFAFDDDGVAQYTASGKVPGRLLNQFSLGEHEGHLRAATHVSAAAALREVGVAFALADAATVGATAQADSNAEETTVTPPYNAVYVLGQQEADLVVVGLVDGIAPGEQIYSARFMGPRGFLVTFRQIDPLFVLDLSDPQQPQVVGELKVPGYSDYLHLLDESHLIGVGRTAWGGVVPNALQLSLFNVSDWTDPTLVQQITLGGAHSYSDVSYTHKAFTLLTREDRTLLALPAWLTPEGTPYAVWTGPEFSGVVCLQVDAGSGFTELGRVAGVQAVGSAYEWWGPAWQRAAIIGDVVYALTPDGVRAAPLSDFGATTEIRLQD